MSHTYIPELHILSRTLGPCCSNICTFQVPEIHDAFFNCYALPDGTLVVNKAICNGGENLQSYRPVLHIIPCIQDLESEKCTCELLAWGGGELCLLAAATQEHILLFSLVSLLDSVKKGHISADSELQLSLPAQLTQLAGLYRLPQPLLAMDFTQSIDGLLITDSHFAITMLSIRQRELLVLSGGALDRPQLFLSEAWRITADIAHTVTAAGYDVSCPCATTSNDKNNKVVVWWPYLSSAKDADSPLSVGAEVLRHPVKVVSLQWSPPLGKPPEETAQANEGQIASAQSASYSGDTPSKGSVEVAAVPQDASHPALLSIGIDWVIRIWVHVVMRDMGLGTAGSDSGSVMSQFCLTLVIEPPNRMLHLRSLPELRASWAFPLIPPGETAAAAIAASSRVNWIVATACAPHPQPSSPPAARHSDPRSTSLQTELDEVAYVWAVSDLSGVVLNSQGGGGGGVASNRTASPRAVLWDVSHKLYWSNPERATLEGARCSIRAYISYTGQMPIYASDAFVTSSGTHAEVRSFQALTIKNLDKTNPRHSFSQPTVLPPTSTYTDISLTALQAMSMSSSPRPIKSLSAHPTLPIAVSLDTDGVVHLWSTAPVSEILPSSPNDLSASLTYSLPKCSAAAWLSVRAPPVNMGTELAPMTGLPAGLAIVYERALHLHLLFLSEALLATCQVARSGLPWYLDLQSRKVSLDLPASVQAVNYLAEVPSQQSQQSCILALVTLSVSRVEGRSSTDRDELETTQGSEEAWILWQVDHSDLTVDPLKSSSPWVTVVKSTVLPVIYPENLGGSQLAAPGNILCSSPPSFRGNIVLTADTTSSVCVWGLEPGEDATMTLISSVSCSACESSVELGSQVSSLAHSEEAEFISAAVISSLEDSTEDTLLIWRRISGTLATSSKSGMEHSLEYILDAAVPVPQSVSTLTWLAMGGLYPIVAAGCSSGDVLLYARCSGGVWTAVAKYSGLHPISTIVNLAQPANLAAVVSGNQISVLSNMLNDSKFPLAQTVSNACGPLPPHHPHFLSTLLSRGKLSSVVDVAQALLVWAKEREQRLSSGDASGDGSVAQYQKGSGLALPFPAVEALLRLATLKDTPGYAAFQQWVAAVTIDGGKAAAHRGPIETGILDMSAFGIGESFVEDSVDHTRGEDQIKHSKTEQKLVNPAKQPILNVGALETGTLDMSAFGMGAENAEDSQLKSSRETAGQLPVSEYNGGRSRTSGAEMKLFSPPTKPITTSAALDTGMLDMSAFGIEDYSAEEPESSASTEPASLRLPGEGKLFSAPSKAPPSSSNLDSGMLDMSAFGMGDYSSEKPQILSSAEAASGQVLSKEKLFPSPKKVLESSPILDSGMLDMSAFGMGGYIPEKTQSLSSAEAASEQVPNVGKLFPAPKKVLESSLNLDSGMLDMSAFGMGDFSSQGPQTVPDVDAASSSQNGSILQYNTPQYDGLKGNRNAAFSKNLNSPAPSSSFQFPHVHSSSTPAAVPLSNQDTALLYKYLGHIPSMPAKAGGFLDSIAEPKLTTDPPTVQPTSCAEGCDGSSSSQLELLELLGLEQEQARALSCFVAALAEIPSGADAAGGTALDLPARVLLTAVRLASLNSVEGNSTQCGTSASSRSGPQPTHRQPTHTAIHPSASTLLTKGAKLSGPERPLSSQSSSASLSTMASSQSALAKGGLAAKSSPALFGRAGNDTGTSKDQSWCEYLGLQPGLSLLHVFWGAASEVPGALMDALRPHIPVEKEGLKQGGAGGGFEGVRSAAPTVSWSQMRRVGAGLWLTSPEASKAHAEALARVTFATTRDPHDVALIYLALNRRPVLLNLFRQQGNTKLSEFLSRDFKNEPAKLAAAKNAFALLGQHRHNLAAAFFLLAGDVSSAIGVLAREGLDPQLGLWVAALVEGGPGGPAAKQLVDRELMPVAKASQDPLAVPSLLWALGQCAEAVQEIIMSAPLKKPLPDASSHESIDEAESENLMNTARLAFNLNALDFVVQVGAGKLSGKMVPAKVAQHLIALAGLTSKCLEAARLHWLAAEAADVSAAWSGKSERQRVTQLAAMSLAVDAGKTLEQLEEKLLSTRLPIDVPLAQSMLQRHFTALKPVSHQPHPWIPSRPSSAPQLPPTFLQLPHSSSSPPASPEISGAGFEVNSGATHGRTAKHFSPTSPTHLKPSSSYPGSLRDASHDHDEEPETSDSSMTKAHHRPSPLTPVVSSQTNLSTAWHEAAGAGHIFEAPYDIIYSEANGKCGGLALSTFRSPPNITVAVSTSKNGILCSDFAPESVRLPEASDAASGNSAGAATSLFGLVQSMLGTMRFTPDPWAAMEDDLAFRHSPALRVCSNVVTTPALASHPERDLFISGCQSGHVLLWRYGEREARSIYVPTADPGPVAAGVNAVEAAHSGGAAANWGMAARLRYGSSGSRFIGIGTGGLVATWHQDVMSPITGVGHADWIHHCVSKHGSDVVLLGDRGNQLVAAGASERWGLLSWWDSLATTSSGAVGEVHWRKGMPSCMTTCELAAGTVVVAGDDIGGISAHDLRKFGHPLWSLPRAAGSSGITAITSWPSDHLATLPAPALSYAYSPLGHSGSGPTHLPAPADNIVPGTVSLYHLVAAGTREGGVVLVDAARGEVVGSLARVHYTARRKPFSFFTGMTAGSHPTTGRSSEGGAPAGLVRRPRPANATGVPLSAIYACHTGLVTAGVDGAVRWLPFVSHA